MDTPLVPRDEHRARQQSLLGLLILILLPFFVFWPVATGHSTWITGDFAAYQNPQNVIASEQWRQGTIPLWNPYMEGGMPLAAVQEPGIFYPINILLWLWMPDWLALGYSVLIHLALTGIATFLFLRSLRLSPLAAFLGAMAFEFSGFTMSHLGHIMILRALPWIGFSLYAFNRWIDSRKVRHLIALGLIVCCLSLSGYPQIILYGSILIGTYFWFAQPSSLKMRVQATGALAFGFGLGAIQLFPGAALLGSGELLRPGADMYAAFTSYSFHPAYLITLLFPRSRVGAEMVAYIGIVPLILALIGAMTESTHQEKRLKRFFLIWAGISMFLSFGQYVGFFTRWTFHIPLYRSFGVISKHLLEFDFSLAVLAAFGMESLLQGNWHRRLKVKTAGGILGFLSFAGVLIFLNPFTSETLPLYWYPISAAVYRPLALLLGAIALLTLSPWQKKSHGGWVATALLALTVFDLTDFGPSIYSQGMSSPGFYTSSPANVRFLSEERDVPQPYRIISFGATGTTLPGPLAKELLAANYNATYMVESLIGHEGLQLKRFCRAFNYWIPAWGDVKVEAVEDSKFRNMMSLFGVRYLLVRDDSSSALAKFYTPIASSRGIDIFENTDAKPRLFPLLGPGGGSSKVQNFGASLSLVSAKLVRSRPSPANESGLRLETWWHCNSPIPPDFTFYVHFLDTSNHIAALWDHQLGTDLENGIHPTSQWACPGYYRDQTNIPAAGILNHRLHLAMGVWIPKINLRLPASGAFPVDADGGTRIESSESGAVAEKTETLIPDDAGHLWIDPGPKGADTIKLTHYAVDQLSGDVNFPCEGVVVNSTNFVRGWKARVDGRPAPVRVIAGALQGVEVPEGKHRVEFVYDPASFKWGILSSVISLGLLLLLAYQAKRHAVVDSSSRFDLREVAAELVSPLPSLHRRLSSLLRNGRIDP